jgi:hypothetical protein
MSPQLPAPVDDLVAAYLGLVDAVAPGLLEGLYLTGSVALGDFRPRGSDVDFVAVTAAPIERSSLAALARVHAGLGARFPRPHFDGSYLTWHDLADDPANCRSVPYAHGGRFHAPGRFELSPITWITLARHGVAARGPAPATLTVWADPAVLDRWTRGNLERYWRPWRGRHGRLLPSYYIASSKPWAAEWGALGVSRLHYTLTTGQITSKDGAGRYALARFPARWGRLLAEALRIRRGGGGRSRYRTPFGRRRDLLAYVTLVIEDGLRLPIRHP